jgi:hypothetical protein
MLIERLAIIPVLVVLLLGNMERPVTAEPGQPTLDLKQALTIHPQPQFPDRTAIVVEQNKQREEARIQEEARIAAEKAAEAEAARIAAQSAKASYAPSYSSYGGTLVAGSYGYALAYGNCVNEPGVNNPGWGNPINWPITSTTPWIGASALFYYNHVAVVTGFWSNGDVEVREQNAPGAPHRYPRSMLRGYR